MILRRLATSIRKQDWIAVIIETLIVVFGVYLGVMLGNLNGDRQQRQLYEQSLERALVEARVNLQGIEQEIEDIDVRLPPVQAALDILRSCRTDDEARAQIEASFSPLRVASGFNVDTKALDQLISNDSFLPFQSSDTREALLTLSAVLNGVRDQSERMNSSADAVDLLPEHIIQPGELSHGSPRDVTAIVISGELASPELVRPWTLKVPMDVACRDEEFLRLFYWSEDSSYFHGVMGRLSVTRIREALQQLDGNEA